jgi:hypothetical protein
MDATCTFLLNGRFDRVWACWGDATSGDHLLIELGQGQLYSEADILKARVRGYEYAGVFGYRSKDRYTDAVCEPGDGATRIMLAATPTFLRHLSEILAPPKADDSVDWLEKLWSKEDTREN